MECVLSAGATRGPGAQDGGADGARPPRAGSGGGAGGAAISGGGSLGGWAHSGPPPTAGGGESWGTRWGRDLRWQWISQTRDALGGGGPAVLWGAGEDRQLSAGGLCRLHEPERVYVSGPPPLHARGVVR